MKKLLTTSACVLFACFIFAQSVSISSAPATPDASAMLDISSANKGVLLPRMTQAERNAIVQPAHGLFIYQTDVTIGLYYNAGTPATPNWQLLGAQGAQGIQGPPGTSGTNGTNGATWLTGTGAPGSGSGVVNDLYLNTSNGQYYRKTNTTTWTLQGNLTGPQGIQGIQGPPGTSSTPEYAYIYNTSPQFVSLGNNVAFDTNGLLSSGITHNPGSTFIFINVSGLYRIEFTGSASQASQFSIHQNAVSIPGSRYGSATTNTQNRGVVIVNITAGDVIQLNNTGSSGSLNLVANTGGTLPAVNASVMITKM